MKNINLTMLVCSLLLCISMQAQTIESTQESYNEETIDKCSVEETYDMAFGTLLNKKNNCTYRCSDQATDNTLYAEAPVYSKINISSHNSSYIGGIPDPLPDTPIDSNIYILLIGVLVYAYLLFKKEKRVRV